MPKGRPDFFGTPVHPQYGEPNIYQVDYNCAGAGTVTIKEVTAKGLLVGGYFSTTDGDVDTDDVPIIKVDEKLIAQLSWGELFDRRLIGGKAYPLVLSAYDEDAPRFSAANNVEIPFRTSLSFQYYVANAVTVTVSIAMIYYTIEGMT